MSLLVSTDQEIWIALDDGVDIYNPASNTFRHFDYKTEEGKTIRGRTVDILEDRDGDIWIATVNDGVFRFSKKNCLLKQYQHREGDSTSIAQDKIITLEEGDDGDIWMGTDSKGISRLSKRTDEFKHYSLSDKAGSISDNSIQKIYKDSYGNIWIGTLENGIDWYNEKKDSFVNFPADGNKNLLYHIQDIYEYLPGQLMVASDNGVGVYKNEEGSLYFDKELNHTQLPQTNKYIYNVFSDREGGLWLGSYFNGLEYIPPTQKNFKFYSTETEEGKGNVINAIIAGKDNSYWIGTDNNGIFRYNADDNTVLPFRTAKDVNSSYYNIHEFLLDGRKLLAATYGRGLEVFDLETGKEKSYLHNPTDSASISSSRVFSLFKSNEGKIYVGTSNGVDYYSRKKGLFKHLPVRYLVVKMIEDDHNNIWMATRNDGLFKYNPGSGQYIHYQNQQDDSKSLVSDALSSLTKDNEGNIWIGSRGYGICRYDKENDSFIRYPNLNLPNEVISSIVPMGDYLWLATNKGLIKWNVKTGKQELFTKGDGLFNEQFSSGASFVSRSGNILLGTTDGFCEFSPNKLALNSFKPPIVFTKLFVNNELIEPDEKNTVLEQVIELTKDLNLKYNQSNIRIDFASLSFISPIHNTFRYKLEGYDDNWQNTDYSNQSLTYTNLPSGKYILKVQGTNNDGVWGDEEAKLDIVITPHFLKSNLAYIIYILLFIIGAWSFITYLLRSSEKRHNEKIRLIKAETQKTIYDSKIEFFTNMTHEIRTPLSLIMGPLEYLAESPVIKNKYGDYLSIIQLNSKRLHTLVTQLLDFRKVDSGTFKVNNSFINFTALLEDLKQQFRGEAEQKNIDITIVLKPQSLFILTDKAALTKILTNLLSNALKFASKSVIIKAEEKEDHYFISVEDDGEGIPKEERDKIFEAFYQANHQGANGNGGIGIGLNMTKNLIELLEGTIQVVDRSDLQKGTRFIVELPRKKENKKLFSRRSQQANVEKEVTGTIEGMGELINEETILLVDDNQEVLDFLVRVLEDDYTLLTATGGERAIDVLKEHTIDLVISDIMMDGMDGLELCKKIKNDIEISHIPIVLLTAKTDMTTKLESLGLGIDAYIEKPFSPIQLKAQLSNLLDKREELKRRFADSPSSEAKIATYNKLDKEFIERCGVIIEENIGDSGFTVDDLSKELSMSRTLMFKKLKAITGMTPNNYIKTFRLKKAGKLLREGRYNITEIGYLVGFNSASYFTKCFSEHFGKTPSEFIKE